MDVRCEKCQTEYELDESRLKPGGVTVKCTNCGHMFKIRKRTPTNVGIPAIADGGARRPISSMPPMGAPRREETVRSRVPSAEPPRPIGTRPSPRADSVLGEASPSAVTDQGSGPVGERQWMVRLDNGETKTCRELAMLQQWIVAAIVTRESLISRSGKTWKRLGDIAELDQYFVIADEARNQRSAKPTPTAKPLAPTMLGVGAKASAAGGTIVPDDDDDDRSTGNHRARGRTTPPPPPKPSTAPQNKANPLAQTELATGPHPRSTAPPPIPAGARATAAWANADIRSTDSMASMPQGPRGGKLSSIPGNEPAFSGRVRMDPGGESSFDTGKVRIDDDDDMMPVQRGSRAGTVLVVLALLVIAGAAGAVYMFVFHKQGPRELVAAPRDAAVAIAVAPTSIDASVVVATPIDAGAVPVDPLDSARSELAGGVEPRIKGIYDSLAGKDDADSLAMRARLATALAESLDERAGLVTDKAESDKLRKDGKQLVIDAAPLAQRALKARADDPNASLAMAEVLRLQGKSARDVRRYLDGARAKAAADKDLSRAITLADAQVSVRDGKLDDALKTLAGVDAAGDNRVQIALALIAYTQNKAADAKPIVDQILATSADHDVARALSKRLDTMVAKTDPLPPEDGKGSGSAAHPPHDQGTAPPVLGGGGGGDYDSLLARANKLAEGNCQRAMELYSKALEQKPTGVEALTGMGYCFLDAKQFSSAFSKFRTALAVSSRYEPALAGIAETYQQQSNKEQAIEAWRRYLDAYPGSPKAKRQLEILGAADTGAGSAAPVPAPAPAPAPVPAPAPAPAPGPAPAPAGSAS